MVARTIEWMLEQLDEDYSVSAEFITPGKF